jgi:hypothetical protein
MSLLRGFCLSFFKGVGEALAKLDIERGCLPFIVLEIKGVINRV